ncbi:uncharacterized protein LOC118517602 [Anopheles stephensi]|uniref:uncharacterized protein LOC118517602 n=1 Tax=Anopheles stephensi TaxID=30069 RepID=UPI001658B5EC|nr:uncharacterized protein LOC118517602 [Anopheles stephensi]
MSDIKRARKSGRFYRRSNKFKALNPSVEIGQEATQAETCPQSLPLDLFEDESTVPPIGINEPQIEEEDEPLVDYMFSDNDDEDDDSFLKNDNALTLDKLSVVDGIRYWALSTNATHKSIDMVLKLFRKVNVKVPATAKTLLQTKRDASSEIMEIGGGQFWYHGIKKSLCNYYR